MSSVWEKEGVLLLRIAQVRAQTGHAFGPAGSGILSLTAGNYREELRQIEEDLFAMAAALSVDAQARIASRMNRVYAIYRA